jgi:hypothetical protein
MTFIHLYIYIFGYYLLIVFVHIEQYQGYMGTDIYYVIIVFFRYYIVI